MSSLALMLAQVMTHIRTVMNKRILSAGWSWGKRQEPTVLPVKPPAELHGLGRLTGGMWLLTRCSECLESELYHVGR